MNRPWRTSRPLLGAQGLNPFLMPMGVDRRDGGGCLRCRTCDGFPCRVDAKSDAETNAVRPAVEAGVRLMTRTRVRRLETSGDGQRVVAAVAEMRRSHGAHQGDKASSWPPAR